MKNKTTPYEVYIASLVKSLYQGKIYVYYDYYQIARDNTGAPALVEYHHDVYLDTTTTTTTK